MKHTGAFVALPAQQEGAGHGPMKDEAGVAAHAGVGGDGGVCDFNVGQGCLAFFERATGQVTADKLAADVLGKEVFGAAVSAGAIVAGGDDGSCAPPDAGRREKRMSGRIRGGRGEKRRTRQVRPEEHTQAACDLGEVQVFLSGKGGIVRVIVGQPGRNDENHTDAAIFLGRCGEEDMLMGAGPGRFA